jgi:hypothetical protein
MTNRNRQFHQNSAHMLVGALRRTYGPNFAKGCNDNERLSEVHKGRIVAPSDPRSRGGKVGTNFP